MFLICFDFTRHNLLRGIAFFSFIVKPNIVLIVADTLRKDYSQDLDELLDFGFVKYDNAFTTSPWTLPSHVSMFTGLFPSQHGVHEYFGINNMIEDYARQARQAMDRFDNLISLLRDEGYRTIEVTANSFASPVYGFNFHETYIIPLPPIFVLDTETYKFLFLKSRFRSSKLGIAFEMIKAGKIWELVKAGASYFQYYYVLKSAHKGCNLILDTLKKLDLSGQFFLFINEMEAHEPYSLDMMNGKYDYNFLRSIFLNSAEYSMIEHYKKYYHVHAKRSVNCVLNIVSELYRRLDVNNSLIIVTADHGNYTGENGRVYHGYYLSDELLKVPLYIKYPKDASQELKIKRDYVSVTLIYYLVKSFVYNDTFQTNDLIVSESYGPQHSLPWIKSYFNLTDSELKKYYSHKIRLTTQDGYLIYDLDNDRIVERYGDFNIEYVRKLKEIFT